MRRWQVRRQTFPTRGLLSRSIAADEGVCRPQSNSCNVDRIQFWIHYFAVVVGRVVSGRVWADFAEEGLGVKHVKSLQWGSYKGRESAQISLAKLGAVWYSMGNNSQATSLAKSELVAWLTENLPLPNIR